jgi:hypothetical protein
VIRAALFGLGALFAATALAQDASAPPPGIAALPAPGVPPTAAKDGGRLSQAYAMLGREDLADQRKEPLSRCVVAEGDPVEVIAARAATAQVVMINEAHDAPRDRAFIEKVAKALAPLGYTTFAAETLIDGAVEPTARYPKLAMGSYSPEPAFGQLLRTVMQLNYRLVAYEHVANVRPDAHFADVINARDAGQASNLINRTVRDNRSLKVLVHVGYSHNSETVQRADRRELRWLALRFKEITGIDPLTIDQTSYGAETTGICETADGGAALPGDRDIYIAHPPLTFERSRPTWRLAAGQRFADIPQTLRQPGARTIVEARYASEPDDAVPVDRILIDPGESIPLLLSPGRYRVRGWTASGGWSGNTTLTVAKPASAPAKVKAKSKSPRRKKS